MTYAPISYRGSLYKKWVPYRLPKLDNATQRIHLAKTFWKLLAPPIPLVFAAPDTWGSFILMLFYVLCKFSLCFYFHFKDHSCFGISSWTWDGSQVRLFFFYSAKVLLTIFSCKMLTSLHTPLHFTDKIIMYFISKVKYLSEASLVQTSQS